MSDVLVLPAASLFISVHITCILISYCYYYKISNSIFLKFENLSPTLSLKSYF